MMEVLGQTEGLTAGSVALATLFLGLGFILILAEIFFVSFGVLGLTAAGCFIMAFYLAYKAGGPWMLALFIVLAVILIPVTLALAFKYMPRTRWGKKLVRDNPKYEDVTATGVPRELEALLGKHGMTVTRCRPSGTADIEGNRVDVVAEGMMIDLNRPVEVIRVEGSRVVVRRTDRTDGAAK
jgi:membrane-bound serine protease (ClpP class)